MTNVMEYTSNVSAEYGIELFNEYMHYPLAFLLISPYKFSNSYNLY